VFYVQKTDQRFASSLASASDIRKQGGVVLSSVDELLDVSDWAHARSLLKQSAKGTNAPPAEPSGAVHRMVVCTYLDEVRVRSRVRIHRLAARRVAFMMLMAVRCVVGVMPLPSAPSAMPP
jgi:hypothetical protein